jgi:hypothetical protein
MFRVTCCGTLLVILCFASGAWAGPIENLQPGNWYEVPNSHLRSVVPSPIDPDAGDPVNVMEAWSGGTFDTGHNRLLVWGGGHSDYGGNEVYAFNISTLSWTRLWGPSADIPPMPSSCSSTYSDGNPCSRHTYDGIAYLPVQDRMWIISGSDFCGPGGATIDAFTLSLSGTPSWTRRANPPWGYLEICSDYDPVTGHVFFAAPASTKTLTEYNPATDSYSDVGDGNLGEGVATHQNGVIDPVRRQFISVGRGDTGSHTAYSYNLAAAHPIPGVARSTSGNGAGTMNSADYPGLAFDPVSDRVIGWDGGANVYSLNTTTWVWTTITPAAGNTVVPTGPAGHGTHGRFAYIPSKNAFIVVNNIDENVFIYKLSAGGGSPADSILPAKTTDLRPK